MKTQKRTGRSHTRTRLLLDEWPSIDRRLWEKAISPMNPFSRFGGERSHLHKATNIRVEQAYGLWLSFLKRRRMLHNEPHPARRINPENLDAFIEAMLRRHLKPSSIALNLCHLGAVAKVFRPQGDWLFILEAARSFRSRATPTRHKPPRNSVELYNLGLRTIAASKEEVDHLASALLERNGLMIALLALVPLRSTNLTQLKLDKELSQNSGHWSVYISGLLTKTHRHIEFDWPKELVTPLEHYLRSSRPILLGCEADSPLARTGALWVTKTGHPISVTGLYNVVVRLTSKEFGTPHPPHSFRRAMATTLAAYNPESIRAASLILGHKSVYTTEKSYRLTPRQVSERFTEAVLRLRHQGLTKHPNSERIPWK